MRGRQVTVIPWRVIARLVVVGRPIIAAGPAVIPTKRYPETQTNARPIVIVIVRAIELSPIPSTVPVAPSVVPVPVAPSVVPVAVEVIPVAAIIAVAAIHMPDENRVRAWADGAHCHAGRGGCCRDRQAASHAQGQRP